MVSPEGIPAPKGALRAGTLVYNEVEILVFGIIQDCSRPSRREPIQGREMNFKTGDDLIISGEVL